MVNRLSAASAVALLVAAAFVLAYLRLAGGVSSDSRSSEAATQPSPRPSSPVPEPTSSASPRGWGSPLPTHASLPATNGARRSSRPAFVPFRPSPLEIGVVLPSWYEQLYDVRGPEDALVVGAPLGPQTLPSEVTDPPGSLGDPLPPPVVADELDIDDVGPYAAVVRFTTDRDVAGVVGFGWDDPVNFASDGLGREHRIELSGLVPDTEYVVQVLSHTGEDKPDISFSTEPRPLTPEASIEDGRVELDGQPFFPVTAYGACPATIENLLDAGVNVFQWEHSCGSDEDDLLRSVAALEDRAYWTVPWADRKLGTDGLIGYTQPDEPDGLGLSPSELPHIDEPGKVTFLTLTQHFAPGTGEFPWQHPGYYEGFVPKADVLGVDFYPLQGLCSPEKLALNNDVQVELVRLAGGKPTLQWIEAAEMNCPGRADAAITAETLRAEMLLAIAGGANGLGIFPARLRSSAAFAVRSTLDLIEQAWPMLMAPRVPVEIGGEGAPLVRASARTIGGGTMIVVVNASLGQSAAVELELEGVDVEQQFISVDDRLEVMMDEGVLRLELEPLEAHILVALPPGSEQPTEVSEDD